MTILAILLGTGLSVLAGYGIGRVMSGIKRGEEAAEHDDKVNELMLKERLRLRGLLK